MGLISRTFRSHTRQLRRVQHTPGLDKRAEQAREGRTGVVGGGSQKEITTRIKIADKIAHYLCKELSLVQILPTLT